MRLFFIDLRETKKYIFPRQRYNVITLLMICNVCVPVLWKVEFGKRFFFLENGLPVDVNFVILFHCNTFFSEHNTTICVSLQHTAMHSDTLQHAATLDL